MKKDKKKNEKVLKVLLPYAKPYWLYTLLTPLCIIIEVLLEVNIPYTMSKIVDIGLPANDIKYIVNQGLIMIGMALLSLLFGVLASRFGAVAGMGFGAELRKGIFAKIQTFSFSNMDTFSTASLISRSTQDVSHIQNSFNMTLRMAVRSPFMFISALIMAIRINKSLVSVFLIIIPALLIVIAIVAKKAVPLFQAMMKQYDKINSTIQENQIAIREVKAFVRSDFEKDKFEEVNNDNMAASIKAEKLLVSNMPLMMVAMYSATLAILWLGGNQIIQGTMLTGELISFISYIGQILMSLMMLSFIFIMVIMSRASMIRVSEVLTTTPDLQDSDSEDDISVTTGAFEFKDVFFKYSKENENYVLENINLSVKAGETIGIIGATGSAKTTLVQLIPRLYDVDQGEVLVDGRNVKDYKTKTLRDAVSVVLQKNTLFSGTILDNLRWGNQEASQEEIEEACKIANAHNFISSFPDGYMTELGQGGVNVSGGQKQRLTIARALLKKPKILIMDDSTSAVDTATDASIRKELKQNTSDITVIIIAQRITSVSDADRIVVMDDGKINDIGSHEYLLKNNAIYAEVYHSQQKGVA